MRVIWKKKNKPPKSKENWKKNAANIMSSDFFYSWKGEHITTY